MAASGRDIVTWVIQAGFTGQDRVTAVALAYAAGADPTRPGGLWGVGGAAGDGASQAAAARAAFKANGWADFPAHKTGSWLFYVPRATAELATWAASIVVSNPSGAVKQAATAATTAAPDVIGGPLQEAGAVLNFLTQPITWQRVMKVIIGGGLILIASLRLTKATAWDKTLGSVYHVDKRISQQLDVASAVRRGT